MLVRLPSGAIAPLEVPSLPSLLAAGGGVAARRAAAIEAPQLLDDGVAAAIEVLIGR